MPTPVGTIKTYADLKTTIADWLDRSDQDIVIPAWIYLAEKDMEQKLRHHKMVVKSYSGVVENDGVITLPPDWLEARNMEVNDRQIIYQSPDVLDMYRDSNPDATGDPEVYSFYGSNIEVWPIPTEPYTIEMDYYQMIPALADSEDGTNWLLTDSPAAYLYGALIHSASYLRDDNRIALWDKMYKDALTTLQGGSERAMVHGSRITRTAPLSFG